MRVRRPSSGSDPPMGGHVGSPWRGGLPGRPRGPVGGIVVVAGGSGAAGPTGRGQPFGNARFNRRLLLGAVSVPARCGRVSCASPVAVECVLQFVAQKTGQVADRPDYPNSLARCAWRACLTPRLVGLV